MAAIGAWLGKLVGALGGGPAAAAVLVAGLVAGVVGTAAVTGALDPPGRAGELAIYPCPASGDPMATVPSGQQMLVTGRTADGTWVRIHFPSPGRTEGWVRAALLTIDGAPDGLPVVPCGAEPPVALASPGTTMTAVENNSPSPSPTPPPTPTPAPTPTPTPTPRITPAPTSTVPSLPPPVTSPPDTTGPTLANLTSSQSKIGAPQFFCPTATTISVQASDPSGIASVFLHYTVTNQPPVSVQMTSNFITRRWATTVSTTPNWPQFGFMNYHVVATDNAPQKNTSRLPTGQGTQSVVVSDCAPA